MRRMADSLMLDAITDSSDPTALRQKQEFAAVELDIMKREQRLRLARLEAEERELMMRQGQIQTD